jgi:hypothetical protein
MVPRRDERLDLMHNPDKNHIKDNMEKVIYDNSMAVKIRQKQGEEKMMKDNMHVHKNYGKTPGYINKYA